MRFLLFILLFLSFAYALGLVLANNTEIGVNLLFIQAPTMNLGLLLILCLILGIIIGMLLALLMFRVLQNKWEISRLKKLNANLQEQVEQAQAVIDRQATAPSVDEAIHSTTSIPVEEEGDTPTSAVLTKRKRD